MICGRKNNAKETIKENHMDCAISKKWICFTDLIKHFLVYFSFIDCTNKTVTKDNPDFGIDCKKSKQFYNNISRKMKL